MEIFESQRRLFRIYLPDNWRHTFQGSTYEFYGDIDGVMQISAAFHTGDKQFVLNDELKRTQKDHLTAQVTELSKYAAIHYGVDIIDEEMLQYVWIVGHSNIRMLCTLTIDARLPSQQLDKSYEKVVKILNTLGIFPVSPPHARPL